MRTALLLLCVLLLFCIGRSATGFLFFPTSKHSARVTVRATTQEDDGDVLLYSDTQEEQESQEEQNDTQWKKDPRWKSLSPRVKERIVKEAQNRAIANKKKRESNQDKKRRMLMFFKKSQRDKKRASRIPRDVPFDRRIPLKDIKVGAQVQGKVISLTSFGAYVDIGTECDGLLHVSQISRDVFVEHVRQVLTPGDEIMVTIRMVNPESKKLQLTMLSKEQLEQEYEVEEDEDRIPLEEIEVDDELWGELKRVTDYGAYVELGAKVDGFLHFMDHPEFGATPGAPPSDFMHVGDRVRVWVSDVDMDQSRIKLTANRPVHLPGPRRDIY